MAAEPVRILVIEDDEILVRATLRNVAKHASCALVPTIAGTLGEGLAALDQGAFDVVLLDLGLPDSTGPATLARAVERARGTPIIVWTGQYEPDLPERLFALGAQEYLHKEIALGSILWRTLHHTVERARAQRDLRASEQRLRVLSRRFLAAQEAERRRLALWLHDEIGQRLTALKLSLGHAASAQADVRQRALDDAEAMIADLLKRIRRQSLELRPGMLDDLGLVPALVWFVERFTAQTSGAVEREHAGLEARLPSAVETAAFRIVQAALTNVACHADTDRATVRVWCCADQLHLAISDAGKGFVADTALGLPEALGLASMRERTALLGGTLSIDSAPGAGTRITVELPTSAGPLERGT